VNRVIGKHDDSVGAVALAELEDGPVIVSGGGDGTVRVWDARTGVPGLLIDLGSAVHSLAWSSAPPRLAVAASRGLSVIELTHPQI